MNPSPDFTIYTPELFEAFTAAMRDFRVNDPECAQQGPDVEADVRTLTDDFFDMDIEEIMAHIEGHGLATA